jgi:F-type H+-transporting ATPase subunit b
MPQLNFHWFPSELFWLAITFAALYLVMARFTLPHIGKIIESRQGKIGAELARADSQRKEAEGLERQYKADLEKAHGMAGKIITEVEKSTASAAVLRNAELDKTLAENLDIAKEKIAKTKEKALSEMQAHQVEITSLILGKIANLHLSETQIKSAITAQEKIKNV